MPRPARRAAAATAVAAGLSLLARAGRRYRQVLAEGRVRTRGEVEALRAARHARASAWRTPVSVSIIAGGPVVIAPAEDGEDAPELEALPLPDASASELLLVDALDASPDAWAAFRDLRRVARDGARVVVVAASAAAPPPGTAGLVGRLAWEVGARHSALLPARRLTAPGEDGSAPRVAIRFTAEELVNLAQSAGFAVEGVEPIAAAGRGAELSNAPPAGPLAPRLRLRLRAERPARQRPLQPWWPAHVEDALPLDYLSPRLDVAALVPAQADSILDVGCAAGALGMVLRDRGAHVTGIELDPRLAPLAESVLDAVVRGDAVEVITSGRGLDPRGYDCIVFADCLEHLPDPWAVLRAARERLRPGGALVVSVPNVRHWDTLLSVAVRGRWPLRPVGIHDRTHLRWFTRRTLLDILGDCGFAADEVRSVRRAVESRPTPLDAVARRLPGSAGELVTFQWLVRARAAATR